MQVIQKSSADKARMRMVRFCWIWTHLGVAFSLRLGDAREKNGKTGMLGQDRLEVRWEAVMFLFNVVNLNV